MVDFWKGGLALEASAYDYTVYYHTANTNDPFWETVVYVVRESSSLGRRPA